MLHILTSAYNSARFTAEHVASIKAQKKPYKHLVCVDGCKDTLEAFKANHHPNMELYYSYDNMGKGLIINSLAADLPDETPILIFDSDDYLYPKTLEFLPKVKTHEIYRLAYYDSPGTRLTKYAYGVMYLKASTFRHMGGYRTDFKCAMDSDFFRRYKLAYRRPREKYMPFNIPFQRNIHPDSLTKHEATAMKSEYRKHAWEVMKRDISNGIVRIDYICKELERVN